MKAFMKQSELILTYLGTVGGAALLFLLFGRIRGYHILVLMLFVYGLAASFLVAYFVGFSLMDYLQLTRSGWLFIPGFMGCAAWCGFFGYLCWLIRKDAYSGL